MPEWGGKVWVRTMTGTQRDAFEKQQLKEPFQDVRARVAVACVCDSSGSLLFTDADIPAAAGPKVARAASIGSSKWGRRWRG